MSDRRDWIWMGHAGHLAIGYQCEFRLATCVGDFIVSTVGEWPFKRLVSGKESDDGVYTEVGIDRMYESMVFHAIDSGHRCCPRIAKDGRCIEMLGYNNPGNAAAGHMALCEKYAAMTTADVPIEE